MYKLIPKFVRKSKGPRIAKTVLRKNNEAEGFKLSDSRQSQYIEMHHISTR